MKTFSSALRQINPNILGPNYPQEDKHVLLYSTVPLCFQANAFNCLNSNCSPCQKGQIVLHYFIINVMSLAMVFYKLMNSLFKFYRQFHCNSEISNKKLLRFWSASKPPKRSWAAMSIAELPLCGMNVNWMLSFRSWNLCRAVRVMTPVRIWTVCPLAAHPNLPWDRFLQIRVSCCMIMEQLVSIFL